MLVGGVIGYKVENDLDPLAVRCIEQTIEVRQRAKDLVDVGVVS